MIVIEKWAGLVTNASPYAIPPGAAVTQVNLQAIAPGKLSVRPGTRGVAFASHAAATQSIVRSFRYPGTSEGVVYQNSAGSIRIARSPLNAVEPSKITVFSATGATSPDRIELSWDAPTTGGATITAYTVQYGLTTSNWQYSLGTITGGTTGATITAPTAWAGSTIYSRVRAINGVGSATQWSDAVSEVLPKGGCTDPGANNYDGTATYDDGSCTY